MTYASIEYSKKLADLFPESEWWYCFNAKENKMALKDSKWKDVASRFKNWSFYPALTTDMLLERLPKKIKEHNDLCICYDDNYSQGGWWVGYEGKTLADELAASDKSLPNALAKCLIYLKDIERQGLLYSEKSQKRNNT